MPSSRFVHITQPVFPNQRNDERIFVIARRHYVDFLFFFAVLALLALIPIILFFVSFGTSVDFFANASIFVRDLFVLFAMIYYLVIAIILLTSWISYYYNIFIVSDERIVEIEQSGLFNRVVRELTFEQVVDISSKTKGFLNTLFDAGDIEVQTAGPENSFIFRRVIRPHIIVEILVDLTSQAKRGVTYKDRVPDLATIGIINGYFVSKGGKVFKIMNFSANLVKGHAEHRAKIANPRTLRQKIDYWWNDHCDQMIATFGKNHGQEHDEGDEEQKKD